MNFCFSSLREGAAFVEIIVRTGLLRFTRNDEFADNYMTNNWIPAYAGMTREL